MESNCLLKRVENKEVDVNNQHRIRNNYWATRVHVLGVSNQVQRCATSNSGFRTSQGNFINNIFSFKTFKISLGNSIHNDSQPRLSSKNITYKSQPYLFNPGITETIGIYNAWDIKPSL